MKTLIVSYLPRGERSHTKKLVDHFLDQVKDQDIEHLDLTKNVPDFFLEDNLSAYINRDYLGQQPTEEETKLLAKMDTMAEQLAGADIVVLAFPMHNFSLPAVVKAYFDSVLLKGKTWDADENGYHGLLKDKKALILMASGGVYEGDSASWDHASSLAEQEFKFMGFSKIKKAFAAGVNMYRDKIDEIIDNGKKQIDEAIKEFYT